MYSPSAQKLLFIGNGGFLPCSGLGEKGSQIGANNKVFFQKQNQVKIITRGSEHTNRLSLPVITIYVRSN